MKLVQEGMHIVSAVVAIYVTTKTLYTVVAAAEVYLKRMRMHSVVRVNEQVDDVKLQSMTSRHAPITMGRSYYAIYCRIPRFPCDSTTFLYFLGLGLGLGVPNYGGP